MEAVELDPVALASAGIFVQPAGHDLGLVGLSCRTCGTTWPVLLDRESGWDRCPNGCRSTFPTPSDAAMAALALGGVEAFAALLADEPS
jgi:hypothetical protein